MNTIPIVPLKELPDARHQVEVYCQSLVDTAQAQWRINDDGETELHGAQWRPGICGGFPTNEIHSQESEFLRMKSRLYWRCD